ncbi:MAG: bifunctional lysylphosphatidylglycerol flippase/synthetase MprF [Brevundimonas sp.]|nr:MAG: bifunctional lysylphosphatidylglycerol flippase/synthetase MprF [Brevundimonas sp.]
MTFSLPRLADSGSISRVTGARPPSRGVGRRLAALAFELSPQVFAVLGVLAGGLMLWSAATPAGPGRLAWLESVLPPALIDLSHLAASLTGFLLLLLAAGLWRRRRGAWLAVMVLLGGGAVLSLAKGFDWEEALQLLAVAGVLWPCRGAFDRRSRLLESLSPSWIALLLAAIGGMLWLGFFTYRDVAYGDDLWWSLITDREVSGFLRAGAVVALLAVILAGRALVSAPGAPRRQPLAADELARVLEILKAAEGVTPDAWLATLGDKALLFSPSGRSVLAYGVRGRRWIAMGEPAGPIEERLPLLWAFAELADSYGGAPVFHAVGERLLADLASLGLAVRKVGETALVPVEAFSLEGKARQGLRTAVNRFEREGATFEVRMPGDPGPDMAELRAVSDAWLARHNGAEKRFSLGCFDADYLSRTPLALVRQEGRVIAFANLLPGADRVAVDLMRHRPDAPTGVMDYLFVRLIQWARDQGLAAVDLGMAPLAGLEDRRLAPVFARVGALVFEEGGALYGFQGLRTYKAKFGPDWRPRFIAAPASTPLPLALLDVALLTSGGWLGLLGLKR